MGNRISARWRELDKGWLALIVICLLALWPLLTRADLPQNTDGELHIYRLAELSRVIRTGVFYPRWAPNFYFGYGYPIFNYYAPLSYYLGLPIELLPGVDAVEGVKFVLIFSLLAGAVGCYGFVRANWGRPAGLVAATAFTYAPYIQYVDPHARGDLAEVLALGLAPLAFWAANSFQRHRSWHHWVLTAVLTAAVITSHNLLAMVFFALLLTWALWQLSEDWRSRRGWWLLGALFAGVGLSAFFWLPVALEQNAVNLNTLLGAGEQDNFDFRNHYLSLQTMLSPSRLIDWGATEPEFVFNLGIMQWLLGLVGFISLFRGQVPERRQAIFFAIATVGLLFMMLPISEPIWAVLPLIEFLQFPWRLLGPVALMLAVLAGIGTQIVQDWLQRDWVAPAAIGLMLLLAMPLSQVTPWPDDFGPTDTHAVAIKEWQGLWLGTTSTSDFVPVTVDTIPGPQESVNIGLRDGGPLDRVNRATLPRGTTVVGSELNGVHFRYQVEGEKAFPLRLFLFDFPGWEATVNGEVIETELGRPEGFLIVPVPAGSHTVEVRFTDTVPRQLGWGLTVLTLVVVGGCAYLLKRDPPLHLPADSRLPAMNRLMYWVPFGLLLLFAVVLEPAGWLRLESAGRIAEPAEVDIYANMGDQIALLGYDLSSETPAPGEAIGLTLYWKALQPLERNYQVYVHLFWQPADGGEPIFWGQADKINPGEFPTERWPIDRYVRDFHELTLNPETGPGHLIVRTGLWYQQEGWRLQHLDEIGNVIDDGIELTILEIDSYDARD